MIKVKDKKEIKKMRKSGEILASVFEKVKQEVKVGLTKKEIEELVRTLIKENKAEPSFAKVPGYSWASCLCVNGEVVHGVPSSYALKNGDILGMDIGVYYQGYHADKAETFLVGDDNKKKVGKFLSVGRKVLSKAIEAAQVGNRVGDITAVIQSQVEAAGYQPARSLVGHGIGRELHEDPAIPGYATCRIEDTEKLLPGMALAIEVIYNKGTFKIKHKNNDGWTLVTADGKLSGLFEETILVTKKGPEILTRTSG